MAGVVTEKKDIIDEEELESDESSD